MKCLVVLPLALPSLPHSSHKSRRNCGEGETAGPTVVAMGTPATGAASWRVPADAGGPTAMTLSFGAERPSCSCLPRSQLSSVHRTPNRAAVQPGEMGGRMYSVQLSASSLRGGWGKNSTQLISLRLETAFRSHEVNRTNNKPSVHQFWEPSPELGRQLECQRIRKP